MLAEASSVVRVFDFEDTLAEYLWIAGQILIPFSACNISVEWHTGMIESAEILRRFEEDSCAKKALSDGDCECLSNDLDTVIGLIRGSSNYEEAEPHLYTLGEVHKILATLAFRHEIQLSERQREFVRQYDRWDDPHVRQNALRKIRRAAFPWHAGERREH